MSSKRKNTPTKLSKDSLVNEQPSLSLSSSLQTEEEDADNVDCDSDHTDEDRVDSRGTGDIDEAYLQREADTGTNISHGDKPDCLDLGADSLVQSQSRQESDSESDAGDLQSDLFVDTNCQSSLRASSPSKLCLSSSPSILGTVMQYNSQRRSMESVLKRLNSKVPDTSVDMAGDVSEDFNHSPKVMDTVQAVLAGEATLSEKERQISEMISHLQNIRENLSKQKDQ
ncbi:unnamed protein product, partial [Candidula unifasciata]